MYKHYYINMICAYNIHIIFYICTSQSCKYIRKASLSPKQQFSPGDREDETGSNFTANMAHDLFAEVFGALLATALGFVHGVAASGFHEDHESWPMTDPCMVYMLTLSNIGGILMGSMLPYIAYMDPIWVTNHVELFTEAAWTCSFCLRRRLHRLRLWICAKIRRSRRQCKRLGCISRLGVVMLLGVV